MTGKLNTFALSNPLIEIIGKEPKDFQREDLIKVVKDLGIERLTFHYTGIDGKVKDLKIPITSQEQLEVILTEGERADGSSLFKGFVDPAKSDLYVIPVYKSAFINPFDEKSLDFVCRFLDPKGELAPFPPDNILLKAAKKLKKETGFELWALGELEFFLMKDHENKSFPMPAQRAYHASAPYVKGGEILDDMMRKICQIGGKIKYCHSEVGYIEKVESEMPEINGKSAQQVEVEFLPTPIDEAADMLILARWIIRNVAYQNDAVISFAPKLEIGHAGSGMHVHMQLMKDGKNIMVNAEDKLSKEARMVIGGLCRYAGALNAFGNMVASSYLRLVPHQEAPTKVCWSDMNRSALIRVPLGWNNLNNLANAINENQKENLPKQQSRQTVELRSPDGSCNTHLLLAGITVAANCGLNNPEDSLALAEKCHVTGDVHGPNSPQDLDELVTCCHDSADRLKEKRELFEKGDIFPAEVIDGVAEMLYSEQDRYLNKELMKLPDAEKLKESRRIMHRDLHRN